MSEEYEKLGFMAGLEIHQQLEGKKLFCSCPTVIREDEPDVVVSRQLRASVGESGEVDVAAAHEQRKQKTFVYQGYHDTTCLVELDEEPVSAPNPLAVETAVMVSEMLSMKRFSPVHVMRKVVVDGSNTSGFQRTMAVASDGVLKDVRIDRLCLEEDSCKVISRSQEKDVYNLSRLGIPLLEITTKPDIKNPAHLQEIAAELGMVLRSTSRVKRGLGTIRQDVNISIAEGSRVEIKGVQDLDSMPVLAANEVKRQAGLVQIAKENLDMHLEKPIKHLENGRVVDYDGDVTKHFLPSKISWIQSSLKKGKAIAAKITNADGILKRELFENYRVGTELSGYAKAFGFGGLIHSDEDPVKYGLASWNNIRKELKTQKNDAFIVLVGNPDKAWSALNLILYERVEELNRSVPSCVRKANADASTTYLRPMPGSARMYPETDVHPLDISGVAVEVPELLTNRIANLQNKYSIDEGVAKKLIETNRTELFEEWKDKVGISTTLNILTAKEKEMLTRYDVEVNISQIAPTLFAEITAENISGSSIDDILQEYGRKGSVDWEKYSKLSEDEVRSIVKEVIASDPDAPMGALMGEAMSRLKGKADGKLVNKLLREEVN